MKTLYVRIKPKTGAEGFFRCGMKFTKTWQTLDDVDNATAKRLAEEQMLEVSEDEPADFDDDSSATAADGDAATTAADGDAAATAVSETTTAKPKKGGK